jgi:hypothetical protein
MTVSELQTLLADLDPNAEIIVTYHIDEHEGAGFYEDDIATVNSGGDHGPGTVCLLTDGFCDAAAGLRT